MDKHAFAELLNGLWAGCGRTQKPDQTTLRVWYFCLHDLTELQLANAIARYLVERSSEYLTVQLIRELSGVQQTKQEPALEAWNEALQAVRIAGGYQSPVFSNPITSHVIQSLGGWVWFCDQRPDNLRDWVRARFLKTYESFQVSAKCATPLRLTNLITESGGRSEEVPIRIGVVARRRIEQ